MSWAVYRIEELVDFHNSKRVPLSSIVRQKCQGSFRYYGAQGVIDFVDGYLFDGEYLLIAEDGENLRNRKQPIAQIAQGQFWVNNHAHIVQARYGVSDNVFLEALFSHIDISQYITGAAQPKLSQGMLRKIEVCVPEFDEQCRIANIIGGYKNLIELNKTRIELLEESARLLYREWFVNLRFPGFEQVSFNDGLPDGWQAREICSLVSFLNRGITPKYDESAKGLVINQKCIRDGRLDLKPARRQSKEVKAERLIQLGDILINSTGAGTLGRVAQVRSEIEDCTVDTHVTIVRPSIPESISFLGVALLELEPTLSSMGVGSTNQLELGRLNIGAIKLLVPPATLQQEFHSRVWRLFEQVDALVKTNELLAHARNELLPKLMSGAIQV